MDIIKGDPSAPNGLMPGSYVRLSVNDTGSGISPDIQGRIFEPFFTTKQVGEGTGMGLAVVHGIVENNGGVISLESTPKKGTQMMIHLPRLPMEAPHELVENVSIQPKPARVLFVDDEEPLAKLGQQMLEELGHKAVAFTDSREALRAFQYDPDRFDLVITDQTMPHLTGEVFSRELLKIRPSLPIILCTGIAM